MRWLFALAVLVFLIIGGLVLTPSPVDSQAWTPSSDPGFNGPTRANDLLRQADLIAKGKVQGPEDVAVDEEGRIYAGVEGGDIVRVWPDGRVESWVNTGGRPLGLDFDNSGNLIVADGVKGLLSVNPQGAIKVLSTEADGDPINFADDVDVAPDGRIYFTNATSAFGLDDFKLDLLQTSPHGSLLRYDPTTGKTEVLMKHLFFANGVAVSGNDDFVLVNETWKYRTKRYWLKGPKAGKAEIFTDNLPGFPDGIAADDNGHFWIALVSPRNDDIDALHPYPFLKEQVAKLPDSLKPPVEPYGLVLALSNKGQILTSLHDQEGDHLRQVTSVEPHKEMLYLGSLYSDRIGRIAMEKLPEGTLKAIQ